MSNLPPPPPPPPSGGRPGGPGRPGPGGPRTPGKTPRPAGGPTRSFPRWAIWAIAGVVLTALFVTSSWNTNTGDEVAYSEFITAVEQGRVEAVRYNNSSSRLSGTYTSGERFVTTAPGPPLPDDDYALIKQMKVDFEPFTPQAGFFNTWLPLLLPVALLIGFFVWMQRRAAGQMGNVMSIGRSRAKAYTADKPSTTFADIAGYDGVKQEITEVVDFLRMPERFKEIGAKVPKGILLVGPPGTGKTLFARAVAGEAGVAFLSVTGSDFMEMFVGVGASRVRDLFQQARKMGRAIIFIDEIDSIGRKRGAGLGGGHDEREQTLNQMLAEMDGFETAEGIVVMAATNRPDILDPALLRPGRFDRQIVVPLPEYGERLAILKVHCRDKRLGDDVDLETMARGTPGMSGAELANLVNEAALFAVRRSSKQIERIDFESARDRVMMGARRESLVLSAEEKRITAYHEGGHALLGTVLPHADPVHKVTILPTGMALGVTQTLPQERHSYSQGYLEDRLCMTLGGRVAEEVVFGMVSTGAQNDLVVNTELARRMVREFGMSDRVGPMAWGSQGAVFLGEDLMHTRDYSDDTARVIDEEVERILRAQEARARELLTKHRRGLDLIAQALLDKEIVDGADVRRLVMEGMGQPEPAPGAVASAGSLATGMSGGVFAPPSSAPQPPPGQRPIGG
jgi:cell division protease FtsH